MTPAPAARPLPALPEESDPPQPFITCPGTTGGIHEWRMFGGNEERCVVCGLTRKARGPLEPEEEST